MSELFEKSIQTLELPRVLEMLAGCAVTEEGRERCRTLHFPCIQAGIPSPVSNIMCSKMYDPEAHI